MRSYVEVVNMTNEIQDLQAIYQEIDNEKDIISICSFCQNLKDTEGKWQEELHPFQIPPEILLSHGICPRCAKKYYPREYQRAISKGI